MVRRERWASLLGMGAILGATFLAGCGGDGGGGAAGATRSVSGTSTKGPLNGATITLQRLNNNGTLGDVVGTATTAANGSFTITFSTDVTGNLAIVVTGGTFRDEATGQTRTLDGQLRNALTGAESQGDALNAQINPLCELAFGIALDRIGEGEFGEDAFDNADDMLQAIFGIDDIDATAASDLTDATSDTAGEAADLGALIAGLSELAENITIATGTVVTVEDLIRALIADASDGDFDGTDENNQTVVVEGGVLLDADALTEDLADAIEEFLVSADNISGLNDGNITSDETIDDFNGVLPQAPVVQAISPNNGSTAGGSAVTITGANFQSGATVLFGALTASNVVVPSASQITCVTPPGIAGSVDVIVINLNGLAGRLTAGFTYVGTSAAEFVANGRALLLQGNVPAAHLAFINAVLTDATNQEARFFRALTNVAVLIEGTTTNGVTVVTPALDTILDQFGIGQANRGIFDANAGELQEPDADADGDVDFPANSPTGNDVRNFLTDTVVPALDAALADLAAISNSFTLTLSSADFGANLQDDLTELSATIEVDFGDVQALMAALQYAKFKILTIGSYNVNVDIDSIEAASDADTLNFQTNVIDADTELLTLESTAFAVSFNNTLGLAKEALIQAINRYTIASDFIRSEVDDQNDDLFTIGDPNDPTTEQQEDRDDEASFRTFLGQILSATSGVAQVSQDPGNTANANDANTFDLDLNTFFNGVNLRDRLPTFVTLSGDTSADAATLGNVGTLSGVIPELVLNDAKKFFGKFAKRAFFFNQQQGTTEVMNVAGAPDGQGASFGQGNTLEIEFKDFGHHHENAGEPGALGLGGNDVTVTLVGQGTFILFRFDPATQQNIQVGNGSGTTSFNLPDNIRVDRFSIENTTQDGSSITLDAVEALH